MTLVRSMKDKLRLITFCCKPQLKEYAQVIVIFMGKTCGRPHACDHAPTPIPILGISSLTNKTVKRNRTFPLNII